MERFTGSCEPFSPVNVSELVAWINAINFEDWPQQWHPEGKLRPSMVTNPDWHNFKSVTDSTVDGLLTGFPGCSAYQRMLSVVMPDDFITEHRDHQAEYWMARVHVPLTTNPKAIYRSGSRDYHMEVGQAYLINTLLEHSVFNNGETPRIHLMFDIRVL